MVSLNTLRFESLSTVASEYVTEISHSSAEVIEPEIGVAVDGNARVAIVKMSSSASAGAGENVTGRVSVIGDAFGDEQLPRLHADREPGDPRDLEPTEADDAILLSTRRHARARGTMSTLS